MKYYQVYYADYYDCGQGGIVPGFYTSKEEAQKCADWYKKHPDPTQNWHVWVEEIDMNNIIDTFIPPMTEEQYDRMCRDFFYPEPPEIPDDYWEE